MLQKTASLVAGCHRRAIECAEKARRAFSSEDCEFYLEMERRWLFLARSYEFTDGLDCISSELDRRSRSRK
jgi:hypothetical protein